MPSNEASQIVQDDIVKFLELLGATNIRPSPNGEWVHCSCLFKHWNHNNGDKHPSFGVVVSNSPSFMCFGCSESGRLVDLLFSLMYLDTSGLYYKRSSIAQGFRYLDSTVGAIKTDELSWLDKDISTTRKDVCWPESFLETFPKMPTHPYLKQRGISPEVADKLDIRYDFKSKRLIFPVRDFAGRLVAARGRDVTDTANLKYWPYQCNGVMNGDVWLGESWVTFEKPIVITESVFDLAKIFHVYENVIAPLTAMISKARIKRIEGAEKYITFFDHGDAGDAARRKIEEHLSADVIHVIPSEDDGDAGAMSIKDIDDIINRVMQEFSNGNLVY